MATAPRTQVRLPGAPTSSEGLNPMADTPPDLYDLAERVARLEADNAQLLRVLRLVGTMFGDGSILRAVEPAAPADSVAQAS